MSTPMREPAEILKQLQGKSGRGAVRVLKQLKLTPAERRALVDFMMEADKPRKPEPTGGN